MWKYFWLPHRKKDLQASLVSSSFRASTSEKSEAFVARERTIKASFVGPLLIVLPIGGRERASSLTSTSSLTSRPASKSSKVGLAAPTFKQNILVFLFSKSEP